MRPATRIALHLCLDELKIIRSRVIFAAQLVLLVFSRWIGDDRPYRVRKRGEIHAARGSV